MFQRYFDPAEYTNHDWVLVTSVIRHSIVCRSFTVGRPRPEEACMHDIHSIFEGLQGVCVCMRHT